MWRIIWYFWGFCRVEFRGASPEWALNALARERIAFRSVEKIDDFSLRAVIRRGDLKRADGAVKRSMCELHLLKESGFPKEFAFLRHRILLPVLLAAAVIGAIVIPKFVWFYSVTGNETVPSEQILRELRELGVGFGTFGPNIQPQKIKNQMLRRIPKLEWVTVTQNGGCAVVVVRERPETVSVRDRKNPADVVSSAAGILTRVSVMEGSCLCKVGDAVGKGDVLVSAYTRWDTHTQVSNAYAEIWARTWRRSRSVLPTVLEEKRYTGEKLRSCSLLLGKKRVNIFGNSGISTPECDKMTKTVSFILPGGYTIPISLEITERFPYQTVQRELDERAAQDRLREFAGKCAREDMISGTIENARYTLQREKGVYALYAVLQCEEMIARQKSAELLKDDADVNNRTDN